MMNRMQPFLLGVYRERNMGVRRHGSFTSRIRRIFLLAAAASLLLPGRAAAQELTGALIGTVKDDQGGVVPGAVIRLSSPALIAPTTQTTNEKGQLRFQGLPPGLYVLDIGMQGFAPLHEEDIHIGVGATIERTAVLKPAGLAESVSVEGAGSRIEARNPGFGSRFGAEDLRAIPTRRASMFDLLRAAPGVSPTSPGSGTTTTLSAFGSGTNENQFLFDGTNFTCPCNGVARAEPGIDFIQEVQVQSVGASAEFGNVQGAVINVVTRQGGERFLFDASYYGQASGLTSQPVELPVATRKGVQSGYERARYRDATSNLGGPVVPGRLWFFTGYQYLRDWDSQPGADPIFPRTYEQNKMFAKLTWRFSPAWQLLQSFHDEHWVNPDQPTLVTPFETTLRRSASVPATTFGHLTHTMSPNTVAEARVGRFVFSQDNAPSAGNLTTANRFDSGTGVSSGAPPQFGSLTIARTTAKATLSHYRPGLLGADHELKTGTQIEKGEHHAANIIPTGVKFVDSNGQPAQAISSPPAHVGAAFVAAAAFVSDAITVGDRLTMNAGLRFDHTRAFSQDLHGLDLQGRETGEIVSGLGTMYTWNLWSPRLGVTLKLGSDGRTILRASYGRYSQGVFTGELEPFHPGNGLTTTFDFVPATGEYTQVRSVVDPRVNLLLDPGIQAPRTDEFSIGLDREIGRRLAVAIAYVRKDGSNFIGWTEVAGQYGEDVRSPLNGDGRSLPVFALDLAATPTNARRFRMTNPEGYSLTYNGLVMVVEKRRANGWQAFGSYTLSRAYGLQAAGGTSAAGAQVSTVSPPQPLTFGRDPNDLINARGRLANDRPHMLRAMGSVDVPRSGFVLAANLQYFSGKPWASTALVSLPQNAQQRILLEPRGSRRLSSQTLLDLRVSRPISLGGARIELMLDVLNALNDTAEEALATDNLFSANYAQPTVFMDPRRAMFSVRLNFGR
jgi:hypothetical protein